VVEQDIDPAANSAEVPWLILQPLVENALKHGIERIPGNGVLRIWARLQAGRLHLGVTDDGPGFPAGFDVDRAGGIGLRNTRARLARLYPGEHELRATSRSPTGAAVEIIIPHRPARPSASVETTGRVHV
jgi:sensor histidine kinase YesM